MIKSPPLLSIRNVSNAYVSRSLGVFGKKETKPVLNGVNLELPAGGIFGLTGDSGCGKTTLARCLLGLIKYKGEILVYGQKPEKKRLAQMVFQDPVGSLNPVKKIGWLIEEPLVIHKMGTPFDRRQMVDEMLLKVGLDPSFKKRRVYELSGGQKQRVCIGRALILSPKLLIADEPISSLDVSTGSQILNLFVELHKTLTLDIFFISHNKDAVDYLCDSIIVMKNGKIFPETS